MNKNQVIKLIGKSRWKEFGKWMGGQTVGIGKDGKIDYYDDDVYRFLEGKEVID